MALGILRKISPTAYKSAKSKRKKTNRDRVVVEIYKFQNRKSAKPFTAYLKGRKITNWTGLRMCDVTSRSDYKTSGAVRGTRASVTAKCIDGRTYHGTGPGDGMYINLRPKKGNK